MLLPVTFVQNHLLTMIEFVTTAIILGSTCGAAHGACNLNYRITPKSWKVPVVIHNLKGYGGHLIVKAK